MIAQYDVAVLGAGIVGVSTALELQQRGLRVVLIDRLEAASETSFGNAGILSRGSLLPYNNPRLWRSLPGYLSNRADGFRYSGRYLLQNIKPVLSYLKHANRASALQRSGKLNGLINHSIALHKSWLSETGESQRLRETGWLKLFRSTTARSDMTYECSVMDHFGVRYEWLDKNQLQEVEPALKPIFHCAALINDNASVDNPAAVVRAYASWFQQNGGVMLQSDINALQENESGWSLQSKSGESTAVKQIVVAAGPWSKDLLASVGISLPMIYERGRHRLFQRAENDLLPSRPILDVDGAYVLSPMEGSVRITSGVELNQRDAADNTNQLDRVEENARQALSLGDSIKGSDWRGVRPTLPDALPAIGKTSRKGLWLNTGHHHVGLSTGPASGQLLAELMTGESPFMDHQAFAPSRFQV